MDNNTWGLQFVIINEHEEFETLLALNTGSEENTLSIYENIKSQFVNMESNPECVIDVLNENDEIVKDVAVSMEQAKNIASLLGHSL